MRKIWACHQMRRCHGNGLNPKIDNHNTVLEIKKKSPGCRYFKKRAPKAVNLP